MPLRIGIVGLPNVGKSTLFNALTKSMGAQAANYPFCTIDPNVGIVAVPDDRLNALAALVKPRKVVPATVEFVDIAGLVRGASAGEGLGNKFLSHIREVDAICHVVRAFESGDILHVEGSVDPKRDRETIDTELALADLETIKKRIERIQGAARTGNKEAKTELALTEKIKAVLERGGPASSVAFDDDEPPLAEDMQLLTLKPVIYAVNASEEQMKSLTPENASRKLFLASSAEAGDGRETELVIISAKIEEDMQTLTPEESRIFLKDLGVESSGLDRLIRAAYRLLGYITYFTAGPEEVRAWTIRRGWAASRAAGVIHTDFEKGFICAETISYKDFIQFGSELKAKEAGKMRQEGKSYVVQDGDVMHFRFNV
ncbi:redox-regulated ATPase YchF [Candidatus Peregrinibacteria bacterium]|nr:redox-regulated ATPase YchF [Candidatus Peregrinibacteria bacterium]